MTYVLTAHGALDKPDAAALRAHLDSDPSGERWGLSRDELRAFQMAL
jgi:hypothetical protein